MDKKRGPIAELRRGVTSPSFELASVALPEARGPVSIASGLLMVGIMLAYVFIVLPARFLVGWLGLRRA